MFLCTTNPSLTNIYQELFHSLFPPFLINEHMNKNSSSWVGPHIYGKVNDIDFLIILVNI